MNTFPHTDRWKLRSRRLIIGAVAVGSLALPVAAQEPAETVRPEVASVSVTVDGPVSTDEIESQLITRETPAGFWIFLNENISQSLGSPRKFFDPVMFFNDITHLGRYLEDRGYFNAQIDTTLRFTPDGEYVDIGITVTTHERSSIDSLKIAGIESLSPDQLQGAPIRAGSPYDKDLLIGEQARLLRLLQSNGYPQASLDSVSLKRFASTNNVSVYMKFTPGRRFVVGDIRLPEDSGEIAPEIITRQLDFESGDLYSEEKRMSSEQNLNRLGLFENASVRPQFAASVPAGSAEAVPVVVSYRTTDMQEITPEFLVVNENNELFSTGLGLGYKHRNLFGGAQNFTITARGRINRLEELNIAGLVQHGLGEPTVFTKGNIESQLTFPYFFSNKTKASITLSMEGEKQPDYTLKTLRGRLSFSTKFATYTQGTTDFNIERIDPTFTIPEGLKVEDTTKQFNFIEAFTLQRDKTNNIFSPSAGFFHSISVEEAGVVSRLMGGFNLPYSEYIKVSFLLKHFFSSETDQSAILAMKVRGGVAQLYDPKNPTPVPLPRRFFTGGSGSVRGWKDKQLAAFGDSIIGGNTAFEGTFEARLQMFPNTGKLLFFNRENIWSVVFVDYGNTWNKVKDIDLAEIALSVGVGLRYETFVGPIRFDLAWRLYDPKQPAGRQWLYDTRFFHDSFAIVHLGIGHAF